MIQCKFCDSTEDLKSQSTCRNCGASSTIKIKSTPQIITNSEIKDIFNNLNEKSIEKLSKQELKDKKAWNLYISRRDTNFKKLLKKHCEIVNNKIVLKMDVGFLNKLNLSKFSVTTFSIFDFVLGRVSINYSYDMSIKIHDDFKIYCEQHGLFFTEYCSNF